MKNIVINKEKEGANTLELEMIDEGLKAEESHTAASSAWGHFLDAPPGARSSLALRRPLISKAHVHRLRAIADRVVPGHGC